ncbi:MAG TPA: polysaccharide biosynthesis C-terminal domain-containing protein [Kofleriaceae bacterium]|nr:polysaccharide biosynthesis C-terminal domain-containing protein [Kofleriaceae bacterium]
MLTFAGHAASLARPLAFALFARIHDAGALGALFLIWTSVELGARLATLGLDRGLRRWSDDDRAAATAAALVISAVAGVAVAGVLIGVLPHLIALEAGAVWPARLVIGVSLPLLATGNVALRAARGETQIAMYVLARAVVEPVLLLVAGVALSLVLHGATALLAGFLVSIAGGAVIAAVTVARAIGPGRLLRALLQPGRWPLRELVPTSVPLGLADLLQSAQGKLDLMAVALVTSSGAQAGAQIAGYAIATELVSGFTQVRQGYDQVIAPIAAELRGRRTDLVYLLTEGIRWNALFALPMALALVVFPVPFLHLLGAPGDAAVVLVVLVIGRTVETVLGPATSVITVVGHPQLALRAALIGVVLTVGGQLALSAFGPEGIAVASSGGAIVAAVLATRWLARRERLSPRWPALAALIPVAAMLGGSLVGARLALGMPHPAILAAVMAAWLAGYVAIVVVRTRRSAAAADPALPRALSLIA